MTLKRENRIIIRNALRGDLPAIVRIYNESIPSRRSTADLAPVSVKSRVPWFKEHDPSRRPLWAAEKDGVVAGWASFQSFYGRPAYHRTAELSVYVAADHRRRGVGRRLLAEAVRRGPGLGIRTLLGFIFDHNAPSLRLFEQFGFQRWGHLPKIAELDGKERGLVIVGLRLAPPTR